MLARDIVIIKSRNYTYEPIELAPDEEPVVHCSDTIIKRGRIQYSYAEKYKLGFISPQEFYLWQQELMEQKALEDKSAAKEERRDHTFWEDDEGDRANVSDSEYDKFLRENGLDVSNNNAVDVNALIQEENNKTLESIGFSTAQGGIDDILKSASEEELQAQAQSMLNAGKDDDSRVLSPEEIAALFASAGV